MNAAPIAIALFNATWQSAVLVAATALGVRLFGEAGARLRCALWSAVFFFCASLPFIDGALSHRVVVRHERVPVTSSRAVHSVYVRQHVIAPPARATEESAVVRGARVLARAGTVALCAYLLGVCVALARFGYEVVGLIVLKRRCRPIVNESLASVTLPRGACLVTSEKVGIPCVLALGRPLIAIPADMLAELDETDLRRIVAHEVAHLERYDDWVNLAERFVLAAFFFNPAMHYAVRQSATEREIACDDRVVMRDGECLPYAECLATLAQRTAGRVHAPAPGLYSAPKQVVVRVERLLDRAYDRSRRFGAGIAATAIVVTMVAIGAVWYKVPLVADAQTPLPRAAHASLIDSLQSNGYTHLSVDQLVSLADADVNGNLIAGYVHAFGHPTVDQIVRLADHGVTVRDIDGWKSAGLTQLTVRNAICLADNDVTPQAVTTAMRTLRAPVSVDDIIRAFNSGALKP